MMKKPMLRFGLAAVLLCGGIGEAASNTPMDRATLRGLQGLKVVIEPPDPELERAGLEAASLRKKVEDRIRMAGVPLNPDATEFVGLRMIAAREKKGAMALCVELGVYQNLSLQRDQTIKTATETWGTQSVLLVWPKQLSEAAADTVEQLVDQFVTAYRSANP